MTENGTEAAAIVRALAASEYWVYDYICCQFCYADLDWDGVCVHAPDCIYRRAVAWAMSETDAVAPDIAALHARIRHLEALIRVAADIVEREGYEQYAERLRSEIK